MASVQEVKVDNVPISVDECKAAMKVFGLRNDYENPQQVTIIADIVRTVKLNTATEVYYRFGHRGGKTTTLLVSALLIPTKTQKRVVLITSDNIALQQAIIYINNMIQSREDHHTDIAKEESDMNTDEKQRPAMLAFTELTNGDIDTTINNHDVILLDNSQLADAKKLKYLIAQVGLSRAIGRDITLFCTTLPDSSIFE